MFTFYFLMSEAIQRMTTAPMIAVPSWPTRPPHWIPSISNSQPPRRPPNRPRIRFMIRPKPPPFINLPAQKPAKHPITSDKIIPMIQMYLEVVIDTETYTVAQVETEGTAALATTLRTVVLKTKESDMSYETDLISYTESHTWPNAKIKQ